MNKLLCWYKKLNSTTINIKLLLNNQWMNKLISNMNKKSLKIRFNHISHCVIITIIEQALC